MRKQDAARVTARAICRWCAALVLVLQGCAAGAGAPGRPATEPPVLAALEDGAQIGRVGEALSIRRVARDAYLVTHEAGIVYANVLVVRMPGGSLVLCSSPYDTETTRALVRWLRDTFRPPRMVAINTHFHPDGTAGNEAYREAGVETYASELTQELLMTRGAKVRKVTAAAVGAPLRELMERTQTVAAMHTFEARKGLKLELGGETVQVFYPGPAHASDNVVVFFPSRRLLFGGCMVLAATKPRLGYTGDAEVANWEAAVQALEPFAARVVIPGHGAPGGPELLRHTRDVIRAARPAR